MKDILNGRIKGREWYRPFAPVVRKEDVSLYFDISIPVPFMSVIGYVNPGWIEKLPAITHADNSARVQTVSKEQNAFLWELLSEFQKITSVGVLLNTSFNGKGKPMINTISDGLTLLDNTGLDALYAEGWLFET
jgi:carbamoyltransferase